MSQAALLTLVSVAHDQETLAVSSVPFSLRSGAARHAPLILKRHAIRNWGIANAVAANDV
jgi:hypothetical protein